VFLFFASSSISSHFPRLYRGPDTWHRSPTAGSSYRPLFPCNWNQLFPQTCSYSTTRRVEAAKSFETTVKLQSSTESYPVYSWIRAPSRPSILEQHFLSCVSCCGPSTGCGRKNSPIWEANKFKTKDDTANIFLFLESTQNAVLPQCVLNKSSLK